MFKRKGQLLKKNIWAVWKTTNLFIRNLGLNAWGCTDLTATTFTAEQCFCNGILAPFKSMAKVPSTSMEPGFHVCLSFFILPWYLYPNYLADYCLYRSKLKLSIHMCQGYCLFSHQKKKRMKKRETHLQCCIIHFIAQSTENCFAASASMTKFQEKS